MISNCSQNCCSIGILPCCVLKILFHKGIWMFVRFVRPLILCVWEIWSGSNNRVSRNSLVGKKRLPHRFWSWHVTRNQRLFKHVTIISTFHIKIYTCIQNNIYRQNTAREFFQLIDKLQLILISITVHLQFNQFAPEILLVFLNRCTGLFLAKNPKNF